MHQNKKRTMAELRSAQNWFNDNYQSFSYFLGTVLTADKQLLVKIDENALNGHEFGRDIENNPFIPINGVSFYVQVMWYNIVQVAFQTNGDDHFVLERKSR